MNTITKLDDMDDRGRFLVLRDHPEFLKKIAAKTGYTRATVSRVFAGKIQRSPKVRAAIEKELSRIAAKEETRDAA